MSRPEHLTALLTTLVLLPSAPPARGDDDPAPVAVRCDAHGDPLPDGVVRRFGTVRLRKCGPVAFFPDGKRIATGGGAKGSDVVFWDRRTGQELRRLPAGGGLLRLRFSPDGKHLAALTGTVFSNPVWDIGTDKPQFTFKGESGSFTQDGRYLIGVRFGDNRPIVGRWEVATGKPAGEWTLPAAARIVACSPDGKTAAYVFAGGIVIYDVQRQAEVRRLDAPGMHGLVFSADGRRLLVWGMGLRLWEVATGKQEFTWDRLVNAATIYADGRRIGWTGYDERSISHPWVVDIDQRTPRRLGLPVNNIGSHLAFSPDGDTLAISTDAGAVELRDVVSGKNSLALDGNTGRIFGLELSPDGAYLATYDNFRALVWDTATGKLLRQLPENGKSLGPNEPPAVWDVRLTADGQLQHRQEQRLAGHWDSLNHPSLERLQKLRLKDGETGLAFDRFQGTIQDVIESPDGHYLAVSMSAQRPGVFGRGAVMSIRLWDRRTGLPLDHAQPPGDHLLGAIAGDRRMLVTTAPQGTIHLWDLAAGGQRLTLHGHLAGNVRAVLFSRDQRFLFSGGDDSQVLQWDLTGRSPDGVWRMLQLDPKRQEALWAQLAAADTAAAHRAIWELAADPAGTVEFLQARLKPVTGPPATAIADLVARLGADDFAARQTAQLHLAKLGAGAVPALRQALANPGSLEQKRRLEQLLRELDPSALSGAALQSCRAIEVLERIGTADARRLLTALANGLRGARPTQMATDALERLGKRG
jgi:WD40 repeat protein